MTKQTPPQSSSRQRNPLAILLGLALLAAVGLLVAKLITTLSAPAASTDFSTETVENSSVSTDTPADSSTSVENLPLEKKPVEQYSAPDPNTLSSLTGFLTTARVSGDKLLLRVAIDQFLDSGTCTLSLTSASAPAYFASAPLVPDVSSSTCEGFDVPLSSLGSGAYDIRIELTSGDRTGLILGDVKL
ncbi:hypothetical protein IJI02_00555 [Candidatus Saccharibacteria bacterium]|nr:hypothetical protein [Candidatus Saccharibacteria bacterium]